MKKELDYPKYIGIWVASTALAVLFGIGLELDPATTIAVVVASLVFATLTFNLLSNGSIYKNVYRVRRERNNPEERDEDYRGFQ